MQGTGVNGERVERPWGWYEVLASGDGYQAKRLVVRPGQRLSYQSHQRRAERWIVAAGVARVTLDGDTRDYDVGEMLSIPVGMKHRLANAGTVETVIIEVQIGSYLGEDDIERFEDDYGRTTQVSQYP